MPSHRDFRGAIFLKMIITQGVGQNKIKGMTQLSVRLQVARGKRRRRGEIDSMIPNAWNHASLTPANSENKPHDVKSGAVGKGGASRSKFAPCANPIAAIGGKWDR
jgi:hypothetical protein